MVCNFFRVVRLGLVVMLGNPMRQLVQFDINSNVLPFSIARPACPSWICSATVADELLILVLLPPAFIKTTIELFIQKHTATCYGKLQTGLTSATPAVPFLTLFCVRLRLNINRLMTFSCGEIRGSKWQDRIEYCGFNKLRNYLKSGVPSYLYPSIMVHLEMHQVLSGVRVFTCLR